MQDTLVIIRDTSYTLQLWYPLSTSLQDYMLSYRCVYIYFSVTDLPLQAGNKPAASEKEIKTCPESECS
jgi:hypothetical protein